MTILDRIIEYKKTEEVPLRMSRLPMELVQARASAAAPARDFIAALWSTGGVSLIAEVKRASPSKGVLRADLDPEALAIEYQANGAAAISVLTDEPFFQGNLATLEQIHHRLSSLSAKTDRSDPIPLLRKDFLVHPYQIYEARAASADAVLLIAAALSNDQLVEMLALTHALGMTALVELRNEEELKRVLPLHPRLVGVNNRNLHDFSVDLGTCLKLRPLLPPDVCFVAESGIHTRSDIDRLAAAGVDAALVGEALVTAPDVGAKVRELSRGHQS